MSANHEESILTEPRGNDVMRSILIVDNEPLEISLLRQMLEDETYRFETASTAVEAKEIVRQRGDEITAVLIDWIMPDVNGIELLGWMKSQPQLANVEVVVHSAEFASENVEKAIEAGAYCYLTKPFEESQLEAIIRAAVSSFELNRRLTGKAKKAEDAFGLLQSGSFRFRTRAEAELLAAHIASGIGRTDLCMGLAELMLNAVEHGNLEISYEEKGRLLTERKLVAELERRLSLPRYRDRRGLVKLRRTREMMKVTIIDQGSGFDFDRYMTLDEKRMFDSHGRGVLMASTTLDLHYIPPGNRVEIRLPCH
jgi:CheY-like chemotaxis protein